MDQGRLAVPYQPRKFIGMLCPVIATGALVACASSVDLGMGASPAPPVVPRTASARLTPAERDFAMQAAAKGLYAVEVSRLAASRAVNPAVRKFAQTLVVHHTQSNGELVALMNARGIAPPHTLAADKSAKLQRLASLPPSEAFDNGYIRVVGIEDHEEAIAIYERARAEARDPELRVWIERALPILRSDLSAAQGIAGTLAG
jgi:putative membrane protein